MNIKKLETFVKAVSVATNGGVAELASYPGGGLSVRAIWTNNDMERCVYAKLLNGIEIDRMIDCEEAAFFDLFLIDLQHAVQTPGRVGAEEF